MLYYSFYTHNSKLIMLAYDHTDIDECAESLDNCEHECLNSQGSFTCRCSNKYWLSSDGYSCEGTCIAHISVDRADTNYNTREIIGYFMVEQVS